MSAAQSRSPARRRTRTMLLWMCVLLVLASALALMLPVLNGFPGGDATVSRSNPDADYWRAVRDGVKGYTAVRGREAGVLVQGTGEVWRRLRNGPVATYGAWALALTAGALGLFYLIRGQVKLSSPRTGKTVARWNLAERVLHWYTALLFIVLAVTGLSLLYGRGIVAPVIGKNAFSAYAEIAKLLHNVVGPPFIAGLLLMIVAWTRHNIFNRLDLDWFKAFGGMVGKRHPSAGRINAGEKAWFWLLVFAGLAVSISGLVLDFPNFGPPRLASQIAHLVHASLAIILMAASLGHIYIGTLGTEGALEGMVSGKVDTAWAQQHHDLWYDAIRKDRLDPSPPTEGVIPRRLKT